MALPNSIEVLGVTLTKTQAHEPSLTATYKNPDARVEISVVAGVWSGKAYMSRFSADMVSVSGQNEHDDVVKYLEEKIGRLIRWERHINEWSRN